jgi:hypothetical protein
MVKNSKKLPPKAPKKGKRVAPVKARVVRGLDIGAREYAKLLNDPCYGTAVTPIYNSSGTGNFIRVETDFILGAEATSVGAACIFVPGLLKATGAGQAGVYKPTTVVDGDASIIAWTPFPTAQPGYALTATMGGCRAISACMQVSYVGSELSRAGVVSLTQTTFGNALNYNALTNIRAGSERVIKMPDGTFELKLAPNAKNAEFVPVSAASSADAVELPALMFSASGIPASTGIRVRLVQVLEWQPTTGTGIINNTVSARSDSTLGAILNHMQAANPNWQFDLITGLAAYAPKAIAWL